MSREYGAEVPFMRSPDLARADTPMVPVIIDALTRVQAEGQAFEYALMVQANSPLLHPKDILAVARKILTDDWDVVFTVTEAGHPPQWSLRLDGEAAEFAFLQSTDDVGNRRQDQVRLYRSTGGAFAVRTRYLIDHPTTARLCLPAPGQRSGTVVIDSCSAIDIDGEFDYVMAQSLYANGTGGRA